MVVTVSGWGRVQKGNPHFGAQVWHQSILPSLPRHLRSAEAAAAAALRLRREENQPLDAKCESKLKPVFMLFHACC